MSLDINLTNVESTTNKSTNVVTDQASNTKYPSVKAVFDWANSAISWIATNGANVLSHLSNTNNPHSTTATQVDALKRDGSNANSDVNLDTFGLDAKFIKIKGTAGNGHLNLKHQSSGASAGGGESVIYADSSGNPKWKNDGSTLQSIMLENSAITGATKTKITYDAKGLVTNGADATTADIADSTDKRYVTDANLVVIGNTSGTNTGDNIAIIGGSQFTNSGTGGSERFIHPYTAAVGTQENVRQIVIPCSMTISNFFIQTGNSQSATGSHVLTLRKNGVDTSVQITIPAGSAAGVFSDTANSSTFAAGDLLGVRMINNASASAAQIQSISFSN